MLSQSQLWLVFSIYPPVTVALISIKHTYKNTDTPNHLAFYNAVLESLSVRSTLECAALCSGTPKCRGFKFHEGNTTCDIRHGVTKNITGHGLTDFTSFTIIGWSKCPDHYIWNDELDFCYKIHDKDKESWDDAEKICRTETDGGRLVILDSAAKHDAVKASIDNRIGDYLVGARRYRWNEQFRWVDGQLVNKISWCPGQPENYLCGSLWGAEGFCMDDIHRGAKRWFICENYLRY